MQTLRAMKRPIPHPFRIAENDETVITLEGPVEARQGDAILTGIRGEEWPIQSGKFFATYDILPNGRCRKKPIEVLVSCVDRPFQVAVSYKDNFIDGKPGDWLVQFGEANYGIVQHDIFEATYEVLGPSNKEIDIESPKVRIPD